MALVNHTKFSTKILVLIFASLVLISIVLGGYMILRIEEDSVKRLDEKGLTVNKLLSKISAIPILTRDYWSLEEYIKEVLKDSEIVYAVIFDEEDNPITHTSAIPETTEISNIKTYEALVTHNERDIGRVELGISLIKYKKQIKNDILFIVYIIMFVLVCTLLFSSVLSRLIAKPVEKIVDLMRGVGEGDFNSRSDIASKDEFGMLAKGFNEMLEHIQDRDKELELYRNELEVNVEQRTEQLAEANNQLKEELSQREKMEEILRQSNEFNQTVLNSLHDSVCIIDTNDYTIIDVNKKFLEEYNLKEEDVLGKTCYEVTHNRTSPCIAPHDTCPLKETLETKNHALEEHKHHFPEGGHVYVEVSTAPITDDKGEVIQVVHVSRDITHRKEIEEKIRYLAFFDSLTKLPNRDLFRDRVKRAMSLASRRNREIIIMFVDLDNFKQINDTLGHHMGDILLLEAAKRMHKSVRASDSLARDTHNIDEQLESGNIVSRQGGDEFAVLLSEIAKPEDATVVAKRILKKLQQPYNLGGNQVYVTASIGITSYPTDGESLHSLFKNADKAMYCAKEKGKNAFMFYDDSMNVYAKKRMLIENNLRKALYNEEFSLFFQPQFNLTTSKVTGNEALIRWQNDDLGFVAPLDFIPIAEEIGLINDITRWVIYTACRQNVAWIEQGLQPISISVNFSGTSIRDEKILDHIDWVLKDTGMDAALLVIELTENIFLDDSGTNLSFLDKLKGLGVKISLDDFGTGYSSLSYLRKFQLDIVKIDRSFLRNVPGNKTEEEITKTIIDLSHILNFQVVAEGVESIEQLEYLMSLGCDEVQGFLVSRPRPAEDIWPLLGRKLDAAEFRVD